MADDTTALTFVHLTPTWLEISSRAALVALFLQNWILGSQWLNLGFGWYWCLTSRSCWDCSNLGFMDLCCPLPHPFTIRLWQSWSPVERQWCLAQMSSVQENECPVGPRVLFVWMVKGDFPWLIHWGFVFLLVLFSYALYSLGFAHHSFRNLVVPPYGTHSVLTLALLGRKILLGYDTVLSAPTQGVHNREVFDLQKRCGRLMW